jgi:hypothetical protein
MFLEEMNSNMVVDYPKTRYSEKYCMYTVYIYRADKQTLTYTLLLTSSYFLTAYRVYIGYERMLNRAGFFLTSLTGVRLAPGVHLKMGTLNFYEYFFSFAFSHQSHSHRRLGICLLVHYSIQCHPLSVELG